MTKQPLVVVGAGPVGSLLALTLARRGFDVEVYERRPDMRREDISAGRSINFAVSTRGLHALSQVGLDEEVLQQAVPMRGRMMHARDGTLTFQRYGKDDSQFINSMSRGGLNKLLMDRAESAHAQGHGRVHVHFHQRLVGHDFERQVARFRDERTGREHEVAAPVIFGTDGSGSALREALAEASGGEARSSVLDAGYKELTMPPADGTGDGPDGRFALEPHALHIWPRGHFMLIALANPDGSFTCTLFLPYEAPGDEPSFAKLPDADAAQAFFAHHFPDALALIPGLGDAFQAAPLGQMTTIHAWPWSHGSALLVGDAAHGVVPFFGQGMNAGFEDCTLLDALLARHLESGTRETLDWEQLFRAYAEARKPDADADRRARGGQLRGDARPGGRSPLPAAEGGGGRAAAALPRTRGRPLRPGHLQPRPVPRCAGGGEDHGPRARGADRRPEQRGLKLGVVPVINENDAVATEEIRFGDNDTLAALVANLVEADLLIILTDQQGLFTADPGLNPDAKLISEISVNDDRLDIMAGDSRSGLGRGGMCTKVRAARLASRSGAATVIAAGAVDNVIAAVIAGADLGTHLLPDIEPLVARNAGSPGSCRLRGS